MENNKCLEVKGLAQVKPGHYQSGSHLGDAERCCTPEPEVASESRKPAGRASRGNPVGLYFTLGVLSYANSDLKAAMY